MNQKERGRVRAFTLIEMLVVLLIISVLLLLFVPNLTKQKDVVKEKGNQAIVKVVESQAEIYRLDHSDGPSLDKMLKEGNIEASQVKAYKEYYASHPQEKASIPD